MYAEDKKRLIDILTDIKNGTKSIDIYYIECIELLNEVETCENCKSALFCENYQ